jgi:Fe2+ transport system protein FeoA
MDELTLSDIAIGASGRVKNFGLSADMQRRLMEMGLTRGAQFRIVRLAPLGDPIEICVRGYHLSLRREEARGVFVEASP